MAEPTPEQAEAALQEAWRLWQDKREIAALRLVLETMASVGMPPEHPLMRILRDAGARATVARAISETADNLHMADAMQHNAVVLN